ncbi:MAG: AbrB/MazE/SpoVT family DNA-binding domain-containing protein [Caulobacteraceae bacterium]
MDIARISSKGQMTIPKKIRLAAHLAPGDLMTLVVEDERVVLRKLPKGDDAYLAGVAERLTEWNSREDEDAWGDL